MLASERGGRWCRFTCRYFLSPRLLFPSLIPPNFFRDSYFLLFFGGVAHARTTETEGHHRQPPPSSSLLPPAPTTGPEFKMSSSGGKGEEGEREREKRIKSFLRALFSPSPSPQGSPCIPGRSDKRGRMGGLGRTQQVFAGS